MKKLDPTNRKILNILQEQGSITNAELAGRIGLAPATVFERVKKLESAGIIRKYVALVNPATIGKNVLAFVFLTVNDYTAHTIQHLSEVISQMPEVLECYRISGEKDYLLKVVADDIPSYDSFMFNKLAKLSHVAKFSSLFVLAPVKENTGIMLEEAEEAPPETGERKPGEGDPPDR